MKTWTPNCTQSTMAAISRSNFNGSLSCQPEELLTVLGLASGLVADSLVPEKNATLRKKASAKKMKKGIIMAALPLDKTKNMLAQNIKATPIMETVLALATNYHTRRQ